MLFFIVYFDTSDMTLMFGQVDKVKEKIAEENYKKERQWRTSKKHNVHVRAEPGFIEWRQKWHSNEWRQKPVMTSKKDHVHFHAEPGLVVWFQHFSFYMWSQQPVMTS